MGRGGKREERGVREGGREGDLAPGRQGTHSVGRRRGSDEKSVPLRQRNYWRGCCFVGLEA